MMIFIAAVFARPKVALVLSGGGAKGFAEIPLLEAIEREGIRPDMVLGTSMGALIGALYASGYTPKQIRETLLKMNYLKILGEHPVTLERVPPEVFSLRTNSETALSFSVSKRTFGSAPGLIGDQNILCELNNHLSRVLLVDDFDKLTIPFRCVATDVSSGEQIILGKGSIVDAVRASISLPGVFTPAPVGDGRYAMDGGLRNNLPVRLARQMGADIVISMDVASVVDTDPESLVDLGTVAAQIFNLIISSNAVEQYDQATIVLRPDLKKFSTIDFFHPEGIIKAGELCVEENMDKIHAIAQDLAKQGFPLASYDYDRESEYDKLEDFVIRKISVVDASFVESGPLPREKEFQKFIGRELNEKTKEELTDELNEYKIQYHYSSFIYYIKPLENPGECELELRARHFNQNLSKLFFSGDPSVSLTNFEPQKYLTVNPTSTIGINLMDPVESLIRLSTGSAFIFDAAVYPSISKINGFKASGEFGGFFKYGSLEPKNYFFFDDRLVDTDSGYGGNLGIRFKYTDLMTYRVGITMEADRIKSTGKLHKSAWFYDEAIFTTLHNDMLTLRGIQAQLAWYVGKSSDALAENGFVYGWHMGYEHRFLLSKDSTSIGFEFEISNNRLPYELNVGYSEYGGFSGMCGYPLGTLQRDFIFAGLNFRQKVCSVAGMPLYLIAQTKVGVHDSYDPFYDSFKPDGSFFAGAGKPEYGAGIYCAIKTIIGNIYAGYSLNSNGNWVVTLGMK